MEKGQEYEDLRSQGPPETADTCHRPKLCQLPPRLALNWFHIPVCQCFVLAQAVHSTGRMTGAKVQTS